MDEQTEIYKVSYLWRGCDHLMGFKEFIDIRRIAEQTWVEISSRESVFERKLIGSFGDGIEFQRNGIDDLFIFRKTSVLSEDNMTNPPVNERMILSANYVNPGYCIQVIILVPYSPMIYMRPTVTFGYVFQAPNLYTNA